MRHQTLGRPERQGPDLVVGHPPRGPLVGDRGVHEPVGQHDGTPFESRADHGLHVVGAVGCEQQGLGPRRDVVAVQQHLTDGTADPCAARLPGEHDLVATRGQPVPQQGRLGRLARPVAPLERDEQAGRRHPAYGLVDGHGPSLGDDPDAHASPSTPGSTP